MAALCSEGKSRTGHTERTRQDEAGIGWYSTGYRIECKTLSYPACINKTQLRTAVAGSVGYSTTSFPQETAQLIIHTSMIYNDPHLGLIYHFICFIVSSMGKVQRQVKQYRTERTVGQHVAHDRTVGWYT